MYIQDGRRVYRRGWSYFWSNSREYWLSERMSCGRRGGRFARGLGSGGGNTGSRARRKVDSSNLGMSLWSREQPVVRSGLVLISISHG